MSGPGPARVQVCVLLVAALTKTAAAQTPPPATPVKQQAQDHLEQGARLYQEGRFAEAIAELEAGQALDPRPEFLYLLGQAERRRGNCRRAIDHYRAILDANPPPEDAAKVRFQLERCERALAEPSSTPPPAPPVPAPSAAPTLELAPPGKAEPWYRDRVGNILCGAGLFTLSAGAVLFFHANGIIAQSRDSLDRYLEAQDAVGERTAGAVLLATGTGLLAGGILHYWITGKRSVLPASDGKSAMLIWSQVF